MTSEAGRLMKNGSSYGLMEMLEVIEKCDSLVAANHVVPSIQKACYRVEIQSKVCEEGPGWTQDNGILDLAIFDPKDETVLLVLRADESHRNWASYVTNLQLHTGRVCGFKLANQPVV